MEHYLKYLIVSTGRSGSVSCAKAMNVLNVPCGHERIFDFITTDESLDSYDFKSKHNSFVSCESGLPRTFNGLVLAESSYMAMPFLRHEILSKAKIAHLIRHPFNVIRSFVKDLKYFNWINHPRDKYQAFISKHIPDIVTYKNPFDRAAYFYLRWNERIIEDSDPDRYKLFRIEDGLSPIMTYFNIPHTPEEVDIQVNSRHQGHLFYLDMIPNPELKDRIFDFVIKHYPNEPLRLYQQSFKML